MNKRFLTHFTRQDTTQLAIACLTALLGQSLLSSTAHAEASTLPLQVTVNSHQDGEIRPDDHLTLREAIALTNHTLSVESLTAQERSQVQSASLLSQISFNLSESNTTIRLISPLPHITQPVVIDGTTQPGYDANRTLPNAPVATPIIEITPASTQISRGLTITCDRVTIRGLSLYGFTSTHRNTASTPPADIFISHPFSGDAFPLRHSEQPPQNVVIEQNWIGLSISLSSASNTPTSENRIRSAFGVSIFNARDTLVRQNYIGDHQGSGIITGVRAENLQVQENWITQNGGSGMPDAVRLEGNVEGTAIANNTITENAGSAIFLFRPEGSVTIEGNTILSNGRKLRRAAIYLMGRGHQVLHNQIEDQPAAGVVVAAVSDRNIIRYNRFARLNGLSIDLNNQLNAQVEDFQYGDGVNPRRNSGNRRLETGNAAINAPQFLSPEFFVMNNKVNIDGVADPGSEVELYLVQETDSQYAALHQVIGTATTDPQGRFHFALDDLKPQDVVSAIATDPNYGTSEPARTSQILALPAP